MIGFKETKEEYEARQKSENEYYTEMLNYNFNNFRAQRLCTGYPKYI